MAESTTSISGIGVTMGLVLGAALGTTAAVLFDVPTAAVAGYGTGGGLIVGAGAARLAESTRGRERPIGRTLGGCVVFGAIVGAGVGGLAAWTADASLLSGAGIGALVGVVHGLLLGGILVGTIRRRDAGEVAF